MKSLLRARAHRTPVLPSGRGVSGFTLIELLVVIAIIAILAAILFPVFAQAREKARQATCASNLKQQALAILMYTQDYDDAFPAANPLIAGSWNSGYAGWQFPSQSNQTSTDGVEWGNAIQSYIKNNTGAFQCPSSQDWVPYSNQNGASGSSYTYNGDLQYSGQSAVVKPSTTVMLWGGLYGRTWRGRVWAQPLLNCGDTTKPCVYQNPPNCQGNGCSSDYSFYYFDGTSYVHGNGDNYAFIDGHAKWYPADLSVGHDPFGCRSPKGSPIVNNSYYCPWNNGGHKCLFGLDNPCGL